MPNVLRTKRALVTIFGLDWLDRLELMILIEDEIADVEISENDVGQIEVVGDLIRILRSCASTDQVVPRRASAIRLGESLRVADEGHGYTHACNCLYNYRLGPRRLHGGNTGASD